MSKMTYVKGYSATSDDGIATDTVDIGNDNYLVLVADKMSIHNSFHFNAIAEKNIDDSLIGSLTSEHQFISEMFTENTGGGCMVDVLMLADGRYIGITDEAVVMYPPASTEDEFLQDIEDTAIIWL